MEWQVILNIMMTQKLRTATSVSRMEMRGWADFLKSTMEKDGCGGSKHRSPDPDRRAHLESSFLDLQSIRYPKSERARHY